MVATALTKENPTQNDSWAAAVATTANLDGTWGEARGRGTDGSRRSVSAPAPTTEPGRAGSRSVASPAIVGCWYRSLTATRRPSWSRTAVM